MLLLMKRVLLTVSLFSTLVFSQTAAVLAESNNSNSGHGSVSQEEIKDKMELKLKETKARFASKSALRKEKLEAVKAKVCNTKKENIIRRSSNLADRADRQLKTFQVKADKVEKFYTDKLIPKGVTVDNYNDLVANIEAKSQAVTDATTTAKEDAKNFDCTADDPKGQLTNFRTDMQNAIKALKEYRTSVKDLIVAIRTAAAKTATSSATNSADN